MAGMTVIDRDALPFSGNSHELEGYLYGGAPACLIFFDGPPGSGPTLHRHPYAEIFVLLEGRARFTLGNASIDASGGQILIAPAGVAHAFVNSGSVSLRQIDIHLSDRFVTEWLNEGAK